MMPMSGRTEVPLHIPARYMVISLLSLVAWISLAPWMLPELIDAPLSYPVVAWTHLLTLGCIGSMILGASVQLVPVALQTPFPAVRAAEASWFVWILGIVLFELGFSREILPLLVPGASLLGVVLLGYAIAITTMFRRSPSRDTVAWHLLAASWLSFFGFILGWLLALTNVNGVLGGKMMPILAAHIICMIAGWIGITLLGVGYKLIGMFTLAERQIDHVRATMSGGFIFVGTLAIVIGIVSQWERFIVNIGAFLIIWGVVMAILEIARMYEKRMRKTIDVHMPFAIVAIAYMLIGAVALVTLTFEALPLSNPLTVTTVWLMLAGCFLTAIQGFFYKISTFLIWLHTYAPLAGKVSVPKLDNLYNRRLAFAGLAAWTTGVITVAAMLLEWLPVWWGWSMGLWIGGALFIVNVSRIARHWRGPVSTPTTTSPVAH